MALIVRGRKKLAKEEGEVGREERDAGSGSS
jgi:hypothetical protein